MKNLSFVLLMFATHIVYAETLIIDGVATIDEIGIITISECTSENKYTLDTMASNPYFKAMKEITSLSQKGIVIVTVRGEVSASKILQPQIIKIGQGICDSSDT